MPRARNILDALRVAALWLLVVAVFFGPAGLGGSPAFASANKTCGVSCPCDGAARARARARARAHAHAHAHDDRVNEHEEHDGHAEADPCDDAAAASSQHGDDGDACKDDCPNCGCCRGSVVAVLPQPLTASRATCTATRMLAPIDAPMSRAGSGVFRPPRSHA